MNQGRGRQSLRSLPCSPGRPVVKTENYKEKEERENERDKRNTIAVLDFTIRDLPKKRSASRRRTNICCAPQRRRRGNRRALILNMNSRVENKDKRTMLKDEDFSDRFSEHFHQKRNRAHHVSREERPCERAGTIASGCR